MKSMKDQYVIKTRNEKINKKSGKQGVIKFQSLIKSKEQVFMTILTTIVTHRMVLYFAKNLDNVLFASL